eukprot:1430545-Amphidinium_carterae.2
MSSSSCAEEGAGLNVKRAETPSTTKLTGVRELQVQGQVHAKVPLALLHFTSEMPFAVPKDSHSRF